jgi:hypothetical protein
MDLFLLERENKFSDQARSQKAELRTSRGGERGDGVARQCSDAPRIRGLSKIMRQCLSWSDQLIAMQT